MREGNIFSLPTLAGGGGYPVSGLAGLGWGGYPLSGLGGGYPIPGLGRGVPRPRSRWGYPISCLGRGYPISGQGGTSSQVWMVEGTPLTRSG